MMKREVIGITLKLTDEGYEPLSLLKLEINKNKVTIANRYPTPAFDQLQPGDTIFIGLTGKGIMVKTAESSFSSPVDAFTTVLPGSDINQFFVEHGEIASKTWIGVVRKDTISQLIEYLNGLGCFIGGIHLLPFPFSNILPLLSPDYKGIWHTGTFVNTVHGNQHCIIEPSSTINSEPIIISDELTLNGQELFPYGLALSAILPINTLQSSWKQLEEQQEQNTYAQKLKKAVKISLLTIAVLVAINTLCYLWFFTSLEKISAKGKQFQTLYRHELQVLGNTLDQSISPITPPSKVSWYADQIGQSVSSDIHLSEVHIYPFVAKSEPDSLLFEKNILAISGKSRHAVDFTKWRTAIQQLPWCKRIIAEDFFQEQGQAEGIFKIRLEIE